MLHKTKGIVLKTTPYAETSVVVQLFTEKFGVQAYLINGVKKARAKIPINMLQPLHLLDLVVYHKHTAGLNRIAEARQLPLFQRIPYDIVKSSMAMFITEMVYKSIKHQGPDEELFAYLYNAICWLDSSEQTPTNFHLSFLLKLTKYLGFYPAPRLAEQPYFDLKEGVFSSFIPGHILVLQEPHTSQWSMLLHTSLTMLNAVKINVSDRRVLLHKLIDFYQLHVEGLGEIKSLEILEEVLA